MYAISCEPRPLRTTWEALPPHGEGVRLSGTAPTATTTLSGFDAAGAVPSDDGVPEHPVTTSETAAATAPRRARRECFIACSVLISGIAGVGGGER
ncbi:hypothetical protein MIAR_17790 [Microbacterium arabinogalactanolyticum]|nr:hypothetical protein MIAR_17790 [Microbacterium arabinogalactanolyticum]